MPLCKISQDLLGLYNESGCLESLHKIAFKGLNVEICIPRKICLWSCCKAIYWIISKKAINLAFFQNIGLISA